MNAHIKPLLAESRGWVLAHCCYECTVTHELTFSQHILTKHLLNRGTGLSAGDTAVNKTDPETWPLQCRKGNRKKQRGNGEDEESKIIFFLMFLSFMQDINKRLK